MKKVLILVILFVLLAPYYFLQAQNDELTITITPPLIKNNVSPGQVWQSAVKLVNNNDYELKIYAKTVDFVGGTENGTVNFLPTEETENNEQRLSNWFTIGKEAITVGPYQSKEIPFIIRVPVTAEPGGHYAAILIGTNPPEMNSGGSVVKVSSLLASLVMLRVEGDIIEAGKIREFSTKKQIYPKPEVDFTVRFENLGNVHVQPQGEIRIYNQFDKEQGRITINHKSEFGNVLPQGMRRWNFVWQGKDSVLSQGRYRAVLLLGFGEQARETITQTLFFWVINFKLIFSILGAIVLFIFIIIISLRRYIKRAIRNTQRMAGIVPTPAKETKSKISIDNEGKTVVDLKAPAQKNLADSKQKSGWSFFKKFIYLISGLIFLIILVSIYFYWQGNNNFPTKKSNDNGQVEENKAGPKIMTEGETETNSPEIPLKSNTSSEPILEEADESVDNKTATATEETIIEDKIKQKLTIIILNGSGIAGAAGQAADILPQEKYNIVKIGNARSFNYQNTIIQHQPKFTKEATNLSKLFSYSVDLEEDKTIEADIVIFIGRDWE